MTTFFLFLFHFSVLLLFHLSTFHVIFSSKSYLCTESMKQMGHHHLPSLSFILNRTSWSNFPLSNRVISPTKLIQMGQTMTHLIFVRFEYLILIVDYMLWYINYLPHLFPNGIHGISNMEHCLEHNICQSGYNVYEGKKLQQDDKCDFHY